MKIRQAQIYMADLNPVKGSEQAGYRPVLVLQGNLLNNYLNTVVIAPLTTNLKAKGALTTYFLKAKEGKLPKDSVVLLFQVRVLDKKRLKKYVGRLNSESFTEVKRQFSLVFS